MLGDVVQQAGGEHLVRVVLLGQQLADGQQMVDEGDLVAAGLAELAGMGAARDRERASDQRRALSPGVDPTGGEGHPRVQRNGPNEKSTPFVPR